MKTVDFYPTSNPVLFQAKGMHPAVISLGLKYSSNAIRGANARCMALLVALKQVVNDYVSPTSPVSGVRRAPLQGLVEQLDEAFQYLSGCRLHSISMGNAYKVRLRTRGRKRAIGNEICRSGYCQKIV